MECFWWFVIGGSLGSLVGASLGYLTAMQDEHRNRKLNRKLNNL